MLVIHRRVQLINTQVQLIRRTCNQLTEIQLNTTNAINELFKLWVNRLILFISRKYNKLYKQWQRIQQTRANVYRNAQTNPNTCSCPLPCKHKWPAVGFTEMLVRFPARPHAIKPQTQLIRMLQRIHKSIPLISNRSMPFMTDGRD